GSDVMDARSAAEQGGDCAAVQGAIGKVADIDGHEVHRNTADDGASVAGYDRRPAGPLVARARRAQETVCVTRRYDGDARIAPGRPCRAIADCLVACDRAYLQNARGQFNDGFHWIETARRRIDAVKCRARPRQIEISGVAEENPE